MKRSANEIADVLLAYLKPLDNESERTQIEAAEDLGRIAFDFGIHCYNMAIEDAAANLTQKREAIDEKHHTWKVDRQSILNLKIKK